MSRVPTYYQVLKHFEYKADERIFGTKHDGDVPCFYCVIHISRDLDLRCVVDTSPSTCVFCSSDHKKCGAVPREYFGAVQAYFKAIEELIDRADAVSGTPDMWTKQQNHRVCVALREAGSAWRVLSDRTTDPASGGAAILSDTIQSQELASMRSMMGITCLQSAGQGYTLDEMRDLVAANTPLYARDDSAAQRVKAAIIRLATAETTPLRSEGSAEDFPFKPFLADVPELKEDLDRCEDNHTPVCPVTIVGSAPVSRPPETPKRRRPAGGASSARKRGRRAASPDGSGEE